MYQPSLYQPSHNQFVETRVGELHELICKYPLGTLVTQSTEGVQANHIPFLLDAVSGKLLAHVPRANPVWKTIDGQSTLILFHGPNSYISPNWYASKQSDGRVVPTWNYAVVHARATARVIEEKAWLRSHLDRLTSTHESQLAHPWKVSDAPEEYVDKLLGAIVGLEFSITHLEGKFKLGQNKPAEDQHSVAAALQPVHPVLAEMTRSRSKK